jgi:hypothetical protein
MLCLGLLGRTTPPQLVMHQHQYTRIVRAEMVFCCLRGLLREPNRLGARYLRFWIEDGMAKTGFYGRGSKRAEDWVPYINQRSILL